jgi:hypothetical protein
MGGIRLAHAVEDHRDHQVIRNERAAIHVQLGLAAELGALGDVPTQEVTTGEVKNAIFG